MGPEVVNKNRNCVFNGPYAGRDLYITMLEDTEREFVVTHNANIKPVSYFTGRETELQELRQRIEDGRKSVLVSGMGGIGKTHICRKLFEEYTNKHANSEDIPFCHIGYIEYNGDMGSSLQNCLKFKRQDSPEQNQEAAWRELEYLASGGKLLLFVDNVDKPVGEDFALQRLKEIPGAVILTSRQASICDEFETYPIGFLDVEQCKEIFEKIRFKGSGRKVRPEEEQDLKYVIEGLTGRHTITVELLAHLAWTKLWTVKRLRSELEEKGFRLVFQKDGKIINIQESYEMLYDLSMLTEAEQNILEAFSVFPYIPLSVEVCNQWLLKDAGASEDDDILTGLYRKGWLQFDVEQESYALHPVFSQFIYAKDKPRYEKHWYLYEQCVWSFVPKGGSLLKCHEFIPFAEGLYVKLNMSVKESWKKAGLGYLIAKSYTEIWELDKAKVLYEKNIEILEGVQGLEGVHKREKYVIENYQALISVYSDLGEHKKKEEVYKKSINLLENLLKKIMRVSGGDYNKIIEIHCDLANMYVEYGEYEKAEKLYDKISKMQKRMLNHSDFAKIYSNLAGLYEKKNDYNKAEELYEKSLGLYKRDFEQNYLKVAKIYSDLAGLYEKKNDYNKAEELYEKSLGLYKRDFEQKNYEIVFIYIALSYLYDKKNEYKKAEDVAERAMEISGRLNGKNEPITIMCRSSLALTYKMHGKYKNAKKLYEINLDLMEKTLGIYSPLIVIDYIWLADICINLSEYERAEELYEKCWNIQEKLYGENHLDIAAKFEALADIYEKQSEYKKSEKLYGKCLEIQEKLFGDEHPNTAVAYQKLADIYYNHGVYKRSEEMYQKCLEIQEKLFGEEHPDTTKSYFGLAHIYFQWGEYKEAEELFEKSLVAKESAQENKLLSYLGLAAVNMQQKKYFRALDILFKAYIINNKVLLVPINGNIYKSIEKVYLKCYPRGNFKQWLEEKMKESD